VDDDLDVVAELSEAFGARRRVVVTTELPPAHAMRRAIRRCVDGIVVAQEAEHALAPTVLAVCASQLVMPASGRAAVEIPLLSYREREILSLAVAGRTNDEIARQLFLATSTVKSHLSASFAKLNVHSRTEAASVLHELEGELPPTGPQTVGDVA
jgi:DNA-binding NarL/FixJ family response regulator